MIQEKIKIHPLYKHIKNISINEFKYLDMYIQMCEKSKKIPTEPGFQDWYKQLKELCIFINEII